MKKSRVLQEKVKKRGIINQYKFAIKSAIMGTLVITMGKYVVNWTWDYFHEVSIQKVDVRNVPRVVNGEEIVINDGQSYSHLSNYIENDLVINNVKSSKISVNRISIKNVKVDTNYKYEDIRVHFGFDRQKQIFSAYAFNNGNKTVSKKFRIVVTKEILGSQDKKDIIQIFDKEYTPKAFREGDIKTIVNQNLKSSNILSMFSSQEKNQLIHFKISEDKNVVVDESILYDETSGDFFQNKGSIEASNDKLDRVVFELKFPYKSSYTEETLKTLPTGKSILSFNILLDKTAYLDYDIELRCDSDKTITTQKVKLHQRHLIRVPVYNIKNNISGLDGEIYLFATENNISETSLEQVKIIDRDLIYTTLETKKEYKLIE